MSETGRCVQKCQHGWWCRKTLGGASGGEGSHYPSVMRRWSAVGGVKVPEVCVLLRKSVKIVMTLRTPLQLLGSLLKGEKQEYNFQIIKNRGRQSKEKKA